MRYSASQLRNIIRQAEQKQRQAIDAYNRAVRKRNTDLKRAVDNYNREVRAHNSRVQLTRQRLRAAVSRLASNSSSVSTFVRYRVSVQSLHRSYTQLESDVATRALSSREEHLVDLSARETENSLQVANALWSPVGGEDDDVLEQGIVAQLKEISIDLDDRWRGAVYALNPRNPDAARHFCASAREIFVQIMDMAAPESTVAIAMPAAPRTSDGRITRRARLRFALRQKGINIDSLDVFADENLTNVMELFQVFNDGTHGSAGTFTLHQLQAIKNRVEGALVFLCSVAR